MPFNSSLTDWSGACVPPKETTTGFCEGVAGFFCSGAGVVTFGGVVTTSVCDDLRQPTPKSESEVVAMRRRAEEGARRICL